MLLQQGYSVLLSFSECVKYKSTVYLGKCLVCPAVSQDTVTKFSSKVPKVGMAVFIDAEMLSTILSS